ncbi:MAG: ribosome silencing factor [Erysipelothrix sp.]|nr:ribosome silencing factor [Erysipelothrix sp.]
MSLLDVIIDAIEAKKGNDVQIIDFQQQHSMVDYFVVCDAPSNRQVWAIVDHIKKTVEAANFQVLKIEGKANSRWVLLDCGDVVVHVFEDDERQVYKLEKLWADYLK